MDRTEASRKVDWRSDGGMAVALDDADHDMGCRGAA